MLTGFDRDLLVPASYGNRLSFPWLIIFFEGRDNRHPEFFLSHGRNWHKWDNEEKRREGFRIQAHVKERQDATYIVRKLNASLNLKRTQDSYQTTSSKTEVNIKGFKDNG